MAARAGERDGRRCSGGWKPPRPSDTCQVQLVQRRVGHPPAASPAGSPGRARSCIRNQIAEREAPKLALESTRPRPKVRELPAGESTSSAPSEPRPGRPGTGTRARARCGRRRPTHAARPARARRCGQRRGRPGPVLLPASRAAPGRAVSRRAQLLRCACATSKRARRTPLSCWVTSSTTQVAGLQPILAELHQPVKPRDCCRSAMKGVSAVALGHAIVVAAAGGDAGAAELHAQVAARWLRVVPGPARPSWRARPRPAPPRRAPGASAARPARARGRGQPSQPSFE